MNMDKEALKAHAIAVRDHYLHGDITFEDAKKELREFIDVYNRLAVDIAARYNQKPRKLSAGEFLRVGFLR